MDVNEHERLSKFTFRHKISNGTVLLLLFYIWIDMHEMTTALIYSIFFLMILVYYTNFTFTVPSLVVILFRVPVAFLFLQNE